MSGKAEIDKRIENRIDNFIKKNGDFDCLDGFYSFMSDVSLSSAYNYIRYANDFLRFANKNLDKLTLDDYTKFIRKSKDLSSTYKINLYSGLKKFSLYLYASGRQSKDLMTFVPRPKFKESQETKAKRDVGYLTQEETELLYDELNSVIRRRGNDWDFQDYAIITILLHTGIRCAALCKLDVKDIDFNNKTLRCTDKGDNVREYSMSENVLNILDNWIKLRNNMPIKNDALFVSREYNRIYQQTVSNIVKKHARKAVPYKKISPHKLRATAGTYVYNKTGDVYATSDFLGHSNIQVTSLYIRGVKSDNKRKCSELMDEMVFGGTKC